MAQTVYMVRALGGFFFFFLFHLFSIVLATDYQISGIVRFVLYSDPCPAVVLQHVSLPALCKKSRGNTRLLGRENQIPDISTVHLTSSLTIGEK